MRILVAALALVAGASAAYAQSADTAAGKARAAEVCAACHGENGVSVSAAIPNLAGQKSAYMVNQLKAFKAGTRKNDIMNAIAAQLEPKDMDNVAAYYAGLKGADGNLIPDKLAFMTAMEMQAGWGKDIPEILRNADWNYAVFNADKSMRTAANQAECLACHKPLVKDDYLFSIKALRDFAKK